MFVSAWFLLGCLFFSLFSKFKVCIFVTISTGFVKYDISFDLKNSCTALPYILWDLGGVPLAVAGVGMLICVRFSLVSSWLFIFFTFLEV